MLKYYQYIRNERTKMKRQTSKGRRIALISIIGVILALVIFCVIYINDYYRATDIVSEAILTDENVSVLVSDDEMVFVPQAGARAGLIFYPGGKVEFSAYAPLMRELADKGILCVLVKMPANLAVLNMNRADGISEAYPDIEKWYMGGHSLGGSMASSYISKNAEDFEGLVLLGAYSTADISNTPLDVISIYGSQDMVMNREKYKECGSNLPVDTIEYIIEGGNHAQFGSYGAQSGDGEATITPEAQLKITVEQINSFIK